MQPETLLPLLDPGHGLRPCGLTITPCPAAETTAAAVDALVAGLSGAHGWIARQSGVVVLPGPDDPTVGAVLEAELGTADASLQVRRQGAGWVWTRLEETAGASHLAQDVRLVTTEGKAALYRRYWSLPADGAAEVVACRLVRLEDL